LIIPFYEPYEHVLCQPPPRLRLYTPTQLALTHGPPFLFLGKRIVGGRYLLLTDRKHLSFVPPDRTCQKNNNRQSWSCRESRVGDIFIRGGGFVVRFLINDVRIGRLTLGIRKENRDRTDCFSDISNQTE
jgi:hypothetical protein